MEFLVPDSGGHPDQPGADTMESHLREIGWTPEARASAARSRARKFSATRSFKAGTGKSDAVIDYHMRNIISTYGPEAGKRIHSNLSIRIGVKTKSGQSIRSTFFSNDGTHQYSGSIRGMRQRIMSWAKSNNKVLPSGFEDRSPSAIAGMFRGMARSNYFGKAKKSKPSEASKYLRRYKSQPDRDPIG